MSISIFAEIDQSKGVYVSRKLLNSEEFINWAKGQGYTEVNVDAHVTIAYSIKPFDCMPSEIQNIEIPPAQFKSIGTLGDGTVLHFTSILMQWGWKDKLSQGASWDYPSYMPHITLSYSHQDFKGELPSFSLKFGPEIVEELNTDYVDEAVTAKLN